MREHRNEPLPWHSVGDNLPRARAWRRGTPARAQERPNIIMLMTNDIGWNDFGAYSSGSAALGHPTPKVDQLAKEGAVFTCCYG